MEVRTEIFITKPPQMVWDWLTDFESWPEWNPIVNGAQGTAALGSSLTITMRGKNGQNANTYKPTIIALDAPRLLVWRATMMAGFLFTNSKILELVEEDGGTRLTHGETFSGLLVPIFCGKMQEMLGPMLDNMNQALKMTLEKPS